MNSIRIYIGADFASQHRIQLEAEAAVRTEGMHSRLSSKRQALRASRMLLVQPICLCSRHSRLQSTGLLYQMVHQDELCSFPAIERICVMPHQAKIVFMGQVGTQMHRSGEAPQQRWDCILADAGEGEFMLTVSDLQNGAIRLCRFPRPEIAST